MYPVRVLCQVMDVSPSGFYAYVERLERGPENQEEQALILRVKAIHERTGGVYGSRRMARELEADGVEVGRYRARSLIGCLIPYRFLNLADKSLNNFIFSSQ